MAWQLDGNRLTNMGCVLSTLKKLIGFIYWWERESKASITKPECFVVVVFCSFRVHSGHTAYIGSNASHSRFEAYENVHVCDVCVCVVCLLLNFTFDRLQLQWQLTIWMANEKLNSVGICFVNIVSRRKWIRILKWVEGSSHCVAMQYIS